ncbi:MAG: alkylmercury lyase [Luteitalea sp.]|nr:alkylmercury lyase [Luteitalea sp.]
MTSFQRKEEQVPTKTLDIPSLAAEFAAGHPNLAPRRQRLALATFRLLGEGRPFLPEELARRANLSPEEVAAFFDEWPIVQRDPQGRLFAFAGLTLEPTSHALEVDGRTLYTWCALDTLFLPELLGRPARIRSTAPQTGETISLIVDASRVRDVAPEGAAMTLHAVSGLNVKDVVGTFCCYVHFFASEQAAHAWAERNEGTYVVSITEGFEYGRLFNHAQLGAALEDDRR